MHNESTPVDKSGVISLLSEISQLTVPCKVSLTGSLLTYVFKNHSVSADSKMPSVRISPVIVVTEM